MSPPHGFQYSSIIEARFLPLVGRAHELEKLSAGLGSARNRTAAVLLVHGDPGIGKTALLDAFLAEDMPPDSQTVQITGFSSESDLPYAGIDRLLAEMPDALSSLPVRLRHALAVATGRRVGEPPDRYQVGLALLSLLGAASGLTVVVVDDAHLLDESSLAALAFVGRRLKAESVLLVFATRPEPSALEVLSGFETLHLPGLDGPSGVALLNAHRPHGLDPLMAAEVVEQLEGHPLAIIDLAKHADAEHLALRSLAREPLPPGVVLQGLYRRMIDALPHESREFALVVAADTTGDLEVIRTAASALGLPRDASSPLERADLVELRGRVRLRHQLVSATVYSAAASDDRRRTHLALESAADEHGFPAAAAMHAAAAADSHDTTVADRLEHLADESAARGALLSRAGLLSRARELTPEGPRRDERALSAAEAALAAGAAVLTAALLGDLDHDRLSPLNRGRYLSLRAFLALFVGDAEGVPRVAATFARAADAFRPVSVELEQKALQNAFAYLLTTEWATRGTSVPDIAERILAGVRAGAGERNVVLRALHAHLVLPYATASPRIHDALTAVRKDQATLAQVSGWAIPLSIAVWDPVSALAFAQRNIDLATARGALQSLDTTYWMLSTIHVQLLNVAAAGQSLDSVRELRRAVGYPAEHVVNAAHLALTGVPMEIVDATADSILATGFGGAWTVVQLGIGARLIGDGDYHAAYDRLRPILDSEFPHISRLALVDFVEAAARSDHLDEARAAVDELRSLSEVTPTPWLQGLMKRSEALVSDPMTAEDRYLAAIRTLTSAALPGGDLARAHLVYGEWLRRQRRRREAREHLASAVRAFDELGAVPFATRARREYAATGESVPPPLSEADLTPRESLVARLAADGRSNPEIAAALFISPNTVDYHLRKVFRKLGIASRRQLRDRNHE